MSARPQLATLPKEELDLLISRALDGDLDAAEQDTFERYLEQHPEARRRKEELSGLVAALKDLPALEPPFALATRVSAQVAERSAGLGSTWHRFGIYPSPGVVVLVAGVLVAAAGLTVFLRPAARPAATATIAEKAPAKNASEEPVQVFLQDRDKSANADQAVTGTPGAGYRQGEKLADAELKRKDAGARSQPKDELQRRAEQVQTQEETKEATKEETGANAGAEAKADTRAQHSRDEDRPSEPMVAESRRDARDSRYAPEAPASKAAPSAAAAPAPPVSAALSEPMAAAKPAESATGERARSAGVLAEGARPELEKKSRVAGLRFTATLAGKSAGSYRILRLPSQAADAAIDATFRLTLDGGRVTGVKLLSVTPEDARSRTARAESFARGLVLEPISTIAPGEADVRIVAAAP